MGSDPKMIRPNTTITKEKGSKENLSATYIAFCESTTQRSKHLTQRKMMKIVIIVKKVHSFAIKITILESYN